MLSNREARARVEEVCSLSNDALLLAQSRIESEITRAIEQGRYEITTKTSKRGMDQLRTWLHNYGYVTKMLNSSQDTDAYDTVYNMLVSW